jgi:hypothetical protein
VVFDVRALGRGGAHLPARLTAATARFPSRKDRRQAIQFTANALAT